MKDNELERDENILEDESLDNSEDREENCRCEEYYALPGGRGRRSLIFSLCSLILALLGAIDGISVSLGCLSSPSLEALPFMRPSPPSPSFTSPNMVSIESLSFITKSLIYILFIYRKKKIPRPKYLGNATRGMPSMQNKRRENMRPYPSFLIRTVSK
jgi:hypothetical protein